MPHNLVDLGKFRFEQARNAFESSRILFKNGDIKGSLNRSYYAIFHSVRALLALRQLETSKHSGVVGLFIKEYVATGIFDKEYSSIIKNAQKIRTEVDYEDFYIVSKGTAEKQIENAEKFLSEIKKYLENTYNIPLD